MTTLFAFIIALTTVIFIHEYGHYRAALGCGVRVLRFSIGFGRPLWRWHRTQAGIELPTEFVVCAIPLGGYIKMLDEREQTVAGGEAHMAFNRKPLSVRAWIVFAGPLANILLTFVLYFFLQCMGSQQSLAVLGTPLKSSIAESAGLQSGDLVKRFSTQPDVWHEVKSMEHLKWLLTDAIQDQEDIQFEISRQADRIVRVIDMPVAGVSTDNQHSSSSAIGISGPFTKAEIVKVMEQGPAAKAGLVAGDWVLSVDGHTVDDAQHLIQLIRSAQASQLWEVQGPQGQKRLLSILPAFRDIDGKRVGKIEAVVGGEPERVWVQYGLTDSLRISLEMVWKQAWMTAKGIGSLLTTSTGWQQVSGPLTMAEYAGKTAEQGWRPFVQFIALISLSIGLLNLLPVPMLDGGHLMYYLWELVVGSSPSDVWLERLQFMGISMVVLLMFTALFNDVLRWFT